MMKKVILFGAAAFFALALVSCKKDHTCTCTDGTDSLMISYPKSSEKKAKDACKAQQAQYQALYGTDITCSI